MEIRDPLPFLAMEMTVFVQWSKVYFTNLAFSEMIMIYACIYIGPGWFNIMIQALPI